MAWPDRRRSEDAQGAALDDVPQPQSAFHVRCVELLHSGAVSARHTLQYSMRANR